MLQYVNYSLAQLVQPSLTSPQQVTIGGITVTINKKFAEGGFAALYSCRDSSNTKYALKYVSSTTHEAFQAVVQEFNFQNQLAEYPQIVRVYGMLANKQELKSLILMEFCDTTLVDMLNKNFKKALPIQTILQIFIPVCEALKCMHSQPKPIIHRDIKVENVLQKDGKWKLCDFGSATDKPLYAHEFNDNTKLLIEKYTTPIYRAPEAVDLFRRQDINTKYDIWSLGCLLYKLCTYKDAFNANEALGILNARINYPADPVVDINMKALIKFILNPNPDYRPNIDEILGKCYETWPELVDEKYRPKLRKTASFDPFAMMSQQETVQRFKISASSSEHNIDGLNFDDDDDGEDDSPKKKDKDKHKHHKHNSHDKDDKPRKHKKNKNLHVHTAPQAFDPFVAASNHGFGLPGANSNSGDPFGQQADPFAAQQQYDPFAGQQVDPFTGQQVDPFAQQQQGDPFAQGGDPFGGAPQGGDPFAAQPDPFANAQFDENEEGAASIDPSLLDTDQAELERILLNQSEFDMTSSVSRLYTQQPNATVLFLFSILPRTGKHAKSIFKGLDPSLVDTSISDVLTMLQGVFEEVPGLRGDFTMETEDAKWAQPLLTLVDAVCVVINERFIDELAIVIVSAYNGALKIYKATNNQNIKMRLGMSAELIMSSLEKLGSDLSIELP